MTIPASELVDLQPRTLGASSGGVDFNGLFLSRSANLPVNTVVPFSSQASVGAYFGEYSDEYALSGNYFLADDNKQKAPDTLYLYRNANEDAAAFVRGAKITVNFAAFQAVTDGALSMTVNGTAIDLSAIDLSEVTSFSGIATALNEQLKAAQVAYDSLFNAFVVTSNNAGNDSSVVIGSASGGTDLAVLMNLTEQAGAITSQGSAAQTLTQTMNAAVKNLQNFVSFMPVWQETDEEKAELAAWCNNQGTRFVYSANEVNNNALIANNAACFGQQSADYYGVMNNYNSKAFCAFAMGFCASVDFTRILGRKTFAYRSQSGLAFTVDDADNARALIGNGYNFYGSYATASESFTFAQNGQISGNAKWLDTYLGQIWLKTSLQSVWLDLMRNANVLPFNADGYNAVFASSLDIISQGIDNGVIVKGVTLSNAQIDQVNREAGLDISDALYTNGYYLQIPDASAATRQERGPVTPNFWYCDGGSIQSIKGTSTTIL